MPFALKAQTTQQQIHEYSSLSSDNTMNMPKSSCEYCKQMAPTCSKQMNVSMDIQSICTGLLGVSLLRSLTITVRLKFSIHNIWSHCILLQAQLTWL